MKKAFKKAITQIHLWLGLATGLIVMIISITGCLYVFEKEIRQYTQSEYASVPIQGVAFVGLDKVMNAVQTTAPKEKITQIRISNNKPNATVVITTNKKHVFYINPYTGAIVKKIGQDWLATVQDIHTSLLLGEVGKTIIKWSVVIFLIMLITGLILWFPGQMRLLKQSLTIKRNASFKRLNYDLHNVLGFYASGILVVIAVCGLYFGFKEVKAMVSFFSGTKLTEGKKVKTAQPAMTGTVAAHYQQIYTKTQNEYPGADLTSISVRKNGEIRLRQLYPYQWARIQNTFFYNAESGKMTRYKLYKDFNRADLIEATNYDLHTGQLFGLFGKIVACIVSLIAASLPVTGFIIWLKKKKKKHKKKGQKIRQNPALA